MFDLEIFGHHWSPLCGEKSWNIFFINKRNFFATEERKTWASWMTWGRVSFQDFFIQEVDFSIKLSACGLHPKAVSSAARSRHTLDSTRSLTGSLVSHRDTRVRTHMHNGRMPSVIAAPQLMMTDSWKLIYVPLRRKSGLISHPDLWEVWYVGYKGVGLILALVRM